MLGNTYESQICSIARALEVVGERWSLLIIRDALFADSTRYVDFQRRLGIATNILQNRLDGFVEAGLMERRQGSGGSEAAAYFLTDKGRDLAPALIALTEWGDRWAAPEGPPIVYRHATCGGHVRHRIVCERCGDTAEAADVTAEPGPGMPADYLERMRRARPRRTATRASLAS